MDESFSALVKELPNIPESSDRTKRILTYLTFETSWQGTKEKKKALLEAFKGKKEILEDIERSLQMFESTLGIVPPDEKINFLDAYTKSIIGTSKEGLKSTVKIETALNIALPLALYLKILIQKAIIKQAGNVVLKLGEKMIAKESGMVLSKFLPVIFLVIDAYLIYSTAQDIKKLYTINNFTEALKDESKKEVKEISITGEGKSQLETLLTIDGVNEGKNGADVESTLKKVNKPFTLHIKYSDGSPETTYTYLKGGLIDATTHDGTGKPHSITASDLDIDVDALQKPSPDWTIRACEINRDDPKKFPDQKTLNLAYEFLCGSLKSSQNWTKMDFSVTPLGIINLVRKENGKIYLTQVVPDPAKSNQWKLRVQGKIGKMNDMNDIQGGLYQMIVLANLGNKLMSLKEENNYDEDASGETFSSKGATIIAKNDYGIIPNDTVVLGKTSWSGFDNQESEWSQWFRKNMATQKDLEGITRQEVVRMANSMSNARKK